jgi:adenylate cyclase 10
VFKFAGDAILVLWPPSDDDVSVTTRRAAHCALEIKSKLQNCQLAESIPLNVKVGVGVGEISILHVGGIKGRMEYLATGSPLTQAFHAEHHASSKEAYISPEAWALIKDFFVGVESPDGHVT